MGHRDIGRRALTPARVLGLCGALLVLLLASFLLAISFGEWPLSLSEAPSPIPGPSGASSSGPSGCRMSCWRPSSGRGSPPPAPRCRACCAIPSRTPSSSASRAARRSGPPWPSPWDWPAWRWPRARRWPGAHLRAGPVRLRRRRGGHCLRARHQPWTRWPCSPCRAPHGGHLQHRRRGGHHPHQDALRPGSAGGDPLLARRQPQYGNPVRSCCPRSSRPWPSG